MKTPPSDATLPFPDNLIAQAHRDVDEIRQAQGRPPVDWDARTKELMERRNANAKRKSRSRRKSMAAAMGRFLG